MFGVDSVHRKREQSVIDRDQHVLAAIDQIGLRCVRDVADTAVPHQLATGRVESHEIATPVASEHHPAGRRGGGRRRPF